MTKLTINTKALNELEKRFKKVLKAMPAVMGQAAVNHFQENITKRQGLPNGGALQRFKGRVFDGKQRGKGILNDTGNLVDSIKIIRLSANHVEVGIRKSEIHYAEIHQQGGQIPITDKMRKFFWAKHYEHASGGRDKRGKARNAATSDEASFWKAMALKRSGSTIKIPARTFMEVTPDLEKAILRAIKTEMNQLF